MADSMDSAKKLLEGTQWQPLRELGSGGGGVVFLCVSRALVVWFDLFEGRVANLAHKAVTGSFIGGGPGPSNADRMVERLVTGIRTGDALAAVKIPHAAGGPDLERLQREVDAMRKYPHPALIRLLDADQSSPPRWFAMQAHLAGALDAEAHRARFRGKPLEILRAVRPIAEVLAKMHAGGAVHRDVKPKNIFVADDGGLILGDLGIVIPTADATRMTGKEPVHSRDWVPDWVQFGDERSYGPEVDIFALAKVMYFLLSGDNVMASQMYKEGPALISKYADTPGVGPTVSLLERCIVLRQDGVTVPEGAMLLREIDRLLAASTASVKGLPAFSFLSMNAHTDCNLPQLGARGVMHTMPAIDGLSSLPIHLAARSQEFLARVRTFGVGQGFALELRLGATVSQRWDNPGAFADQRPGTWTEPVVLRLDKPLEAGWHDLTITALGTGVLTGFTLIYQ